MAREAGVPVMSFEADAGQPDAGSGLPAADVVVDALLGTGLTRDVGGPLALAVAAINQSASPVLALDIPTGLDCDTGTIGTPAFLAHATLTFVTQKTGFQSTDSVRCTGPVHVIDIGVPPEVIDLVASDDP